MDVAAKGAVGRSSEGDRNGEEPVQDPVPRRRWKV